MMRRRSGLVEHPFGTLKCRAGYRHFLVRGFDKVRGEWSLMALCYNLARVLNIIGFDRFIAEVARIAAIIFCCADIGRATFLRRITGFLEALWSQIPQNAPSAEFGYRSAT